MILHEKKVFRFRWDAVEKRPARGRVYIRAKRGDALTTSPLVFSVPADFLTDRNGSRLSRFFSVGYVHVEQNWLPTDSMLLLAQYRSVISLSPGEGSNHPFPGTAHTLSVLCGWSLCSEHTLL